MSGVEKAEFPEGDAWMDNMPDLNAGFNTSSVRKAAAGSPAPAAHDEYKKFAKLDLGNM